MLLGFKRRFAPHVLDGSKTHTIRAKRKLRPKVGEICHCYTGLRQKGAELLGRWLCVRVEPISIYLRGNGTFGVVVSGEQLTIDEKNQLAWSDGFRGKQPFIEMMQYWMETHGDGTVVVAVEVARGVSEPIVKSTATTLEFEGDLIHWHFEVKQRAPRWRSVLKRLKVAA